MPWEVRPGLSASASPVTPRAFRTPAVDSVTSRFKARKAVPGRIGAPRRSNPLGLNRALGVAIVLVFSVVLLFTATAWYSDATAFPGVPAVATHTAPSASFEALASSPCLATGGSPTQSVCLHSTSQGALNPTALGFPVRAHWSEVWPTFSPGNRTQPALAYDAADGYLLLFGGTFANKSDVGKGRCLTDTWVYSGSVWTNLSISGPTNVCSPTLAYDSADGYVLAFGGFFQNISNGVHYASGETWKFSRGAWTELNISGPPARSGTFMVYDPASAAVLLWGGWGYNDTWSYAHGSWTELLSSGGPSAYEVPEGAVTYDGVARTVLLVEESPTTGANATWEFVGNGWARLRSAGTPYELNPVVGFDPVDGIVLFYGGADRTTGYESNITWGFTGTSWANLGIKGPPGRQLAGFSFDPTEGGMLLFGGWACCVPFPLYSSGNLGDTWIIGIAPSNISLATVVTPASICSISVPNCPAGVIDARVDLRAEVLTSPLDSNSSSNSTIHYGPTHWLDQPVFRFVPWKGVAVDLSRPIVTACVRDGSPSGCPSGIVNFTGRPGGVASIDWSWSTNPLNDVLYLGDEWSASLFVQVNVPPPAQVVVDACTTTACTVAGSSAVAANLTELRFAPYGNSTVRETSYPPAIVGIVPIPSTQSGPPSTSPPPPPGLGPPIPAPPPPIATPLPVSSPVASLVAAGGTPLSLQATAAGLLAAGFSRVALRAGPQAMPQAIRVATALRGGAPGPRERIRGE